MPAPIQAERFLFAGELLGLRPRWSVRERRGVAAACRNGLTTRSCVLQVAEGAEKVGLTFIPVPLMPCAVLARRVDRRHETWPKHQRRRGSTTVAVLRQRVERAG